MKIGIGKLNEDGVWRVGRVGEGELEVLGGAHRGEDRVLCADRLAEQTQDAVVLLLGAIHLHRLQVSSAVVTHHLH